MIERYTRSETDRKLHIGCGGNLLKGWLNTDLFPENEEAAILDASKSFPLADNSFLYVYSEHVFEHIDLNGQLNYLKESYRILKPGGKIRIATPDFDRIISLTHTENPVRNEYLDWNFDHFLPNLPQQLKENAAVYVINNYFKAWGHQLIHNRASLEQLLKYSGFKKIAFQEIGKSEDPHLQNLEQHAKMITETFNRFETMVIEALKG